MTRIDTLKSGLTHYVYYTTKFATRMDTPNKVVIFTQNT